MQATKTKTKIKPKSKTAAKPKTSVKPKKRKPTKPSAKLFPPSKRVKVALKLFLFTPQGKSGIKSHPFTAYVAPSAATRVVRAFYKGPINAVMRFLDAPSKELIAKLKIDPATAVNGEVGVDKKTIKKHAPGLL